MIATVSAVLFLALAGRGLLRLLVGARPARAFGLLAVAGLSLLLGAIVVGLVTILVAVLGLPTRIWPWIGVLVGLFALLGLLPRRIYRWLPLPGREGFDDQEHDPRPPHARLGDGLCAVAVLVIAAVELIGSSRLAVCCNDEYAIWAIRARTLSLAGHLDPAVFTGAQAYYQHLDYPLLQPALIAWGDGLAGHLDDGAAHALLIMLTLGMLSVLGSVLNRLAGPLAGVCAVLLVAGIPGLLGPLGLQLVADIPVASMTIAMMAAFACWVVRGDTRWLAVGAALAAGAASTKVEGSLYALAGLAAVLIVVPAGVPRPRRKALVAAGAVVATMIPWQLWTHAHHIESDLINGRSLSLHHLRQVAPYWRFTAHLMVDFWPGYGWIGALGAAAACALALTLAPCRRLVGYLACLWALMVVGLWAQYVVSAGLTTAPIAVGLRGHFGSSAPRVLITPSAVLVSAIPLLAGAVLVTGARRRTQPSRPREPAPPPDPGADELTSSASS